MWEIKQQKILNNLKQFLIIAPILAIINYEKEVKEIILAINTSKKGQRAVLIQADIKEKRHPVRFKSDIWTKIKN